MRFSALSVLVLFLTAGPAMAQKVFVDYDKEFDRTTIKTFAWKATEETSVKKGSPLLHSRIVNGIEYYLTLGGLRENEDAPDVYVTYHTSTRKEVSFNTTSFGYGYPSSWYHGGYYPRYYGYAPTYSTVAATTTVSTYHKGTLVIDVWDAASNKLIWRGTAANITVVDSPTKMEKRIDKALKKMIERWKKIKAQDAKEKKKAAG